MKMDNINQKLTEWHEETEQSETDYIQDLFVTYTIIQNITSSEM